jgi:putative secretion ATPase (PEP-CTERM system associated)
MYERFYNLRERPFALSPDPEYLYLSRVHREALDAIRFGIESRVGFIVVTGEIGAGKTTVLQTLLRRLDERAVVARLVNTILEPRELLDAIAIDFGLDPNGKSKPMLLRELADFLVQQRTQGRASLLVVDEAQNLTPQALEEIRLLSNLETEKSKLLQIVLAGQPNLRDTIDSPVLEQLRQRITVNYHLTPLDAADTQAYVNYRLEHAALGEPPRFTRDAAALIHARSGGVPRIINVICDAALIYGYAEEQRSLDRRLLAVVVEELESTRILLPQDGSLHGRVPPAAADAKAAAPAPQAVAHPAPASSDAELRRLEQWVAVQEAELMRQREAVERRNSDLVSREQALVARERRVVEQQRILSEEYRLMRQQHRPTSASVKPPTADQEVAAAVRVHAPPSAPPSALQRLFQALRLDTGWVDPAARRR